MKIEISFWYWYYTGATLALSRFANGRITNLMNVPIEKASIVLLYTNKDGTLSEETTLDFFSIPARMSEGFYDKKIPLSKTFLIDDSYVRILRTVIVYAAWLQIEVPVAYTLGETRTFTYVTAGTIAYTISGPLDYLGPTGGILLFAVAAIAVILIVVAFGIRGKAHAPPVAPSPISPPPEILSVRTKHCPECGLVMPLDAKHCPKCGAKQDYFGED